ncbi:Clp protease ClpP [bacterium]|nr:Clp protease ClpP [bacterium]
MKRFFNIQTGKDGESVIFLYGDIGDSYDVSSGRIVSELLEAEKTSRRINVRINSNGGDVYSGIAIFNALKNSQADIHIYVDGIAASMASVIALCGKPLQMSKYARLMLHSVSGGCYGNKKDLRKCIAEIESLEDSLSDICAGRLAMSKEEVKTLYFDNEDHWLTADEALRLGFIDAIYDAEPVPAGSTPEQIYTLFNNRLTKPQITTDTMNLEELKKRARFKNCATDSDALAEIDKLEAQAARADALESENSGLKAKVKTYEDKAAADAAAERKSLLDAAESDGRINAQTRPTFENILKHDPEAGKTALAALTPKRSVMQDINRTPASKGAWELRQAEIRENRRNRR